jgi:hypothetical protein
MAANRKLPAHAFQPGNPCGLGRPKGVRNRLTDTVTTVLSEYFELHGREVIERVRAKYPQVYLSAIISLLPKQTTVEKLLPLGELSDDELVMIEEMLASSRARLVQQPKRQNGLC